MTLVAICGPYRFDAAVVEVLSEDNGIQSAGLEMRIEEKPQNQDTVANLLK